MAFQTPILLIAFNRPDHTAKVLSVIKKQRPKRMFVFRDGPRTKVPDDVQRCNGVVDLIMREIDWNCELETCIESENQGCGYGPAKAITWFFEHVDQGIILEDDCVPDQSFFPFCEELLNRFKNDQKISVISGTNPLLRWKNKKCSYVFSRIGNICGWATWRRAWKNFDYTAKLWKTTQGKERVKKTINNRLLFAHFCHEFDSYFKTAKRDVWDFQWLFCRLVHSSYSIVPCLNLVSNIGFNEYATHTFDSNSAMANLNTYSLYFPLKHTEFKIDNLYDRIVFERFINPKKRSIQNKVLIKSLESISRIGLKDPFSFRR